MIPVLTPAQFAAVKALVKDGADNETLARRLGINRETLKTHLKNAMAATGYPNRTALALAIVRGEVEVSVENRRWSQHSPARVEPGAWA